MKRVVDGVNGSNSMYRYYVYHQDEVLSEYNSTGDILVNYQHSGLRTDDVMGAVVTESGVEAGIAPTAGVYRFLKDAQGSVTEILDSTNTLKEHIVYSSFGVPLQILDSNRSPANAAQYKFIYGYTGREIDRESGLYYYRARYYDPTIGRFLQKDPHPGKMNIPGTVINGYSYALNSPTHFTDPSGRFIFAIFGFVAIFGAEVAVGASIGSALLTAGITLGAASLGSAAAAGIESLITGKSFWSAFERNFDIAGGFLAAAVGLSAVFGGGYAGAGANTIFQGAVKSNAPIFGQGGALTIGSGSLFSGHEIGFGLAAHELGHTLQFIGLSTLGPIGGYGIYGAMGGLGILGGSIGTWWENNASTLGGSFYGWDAI